MKHAWCAAFVAWLGLSGCGQPAPPGDGVEQRETPRHPNVVLIMADDLGYGDISPYGGWIETPHLQALADGGVRFTDFHSSGNVCSPTRAGLMTGLYQQRLGIPGVLFANPARPSHHEGIGADATTIAEVMREHGYATAIFGKWHLGYRPEFNPTLHGFDTFRGFVSGNLDYHSHIDMMGRPDWWADAGLQAEEGYLTDLIAEHALGFIEAHVDEPFLLYLPHHAPHFPFQGRNDPADRTVGGEFDNLGSAQDRQRAYREMVQAVDDGVGRVVATLERLGLADDTIVWFFSDNGAAEWGSNAPLRGGKATDWEGGHRVPAILSWPGTVEPGVSDALGWTIDVMPTVLGWTGIEYSGDQDGIDLAPAIAGGELSDRRLFWGADGTFWEGSAMREGQYKLIIDLSGEADGTPQLFDLDQDLGEQHDIAAEQPTRAKRMLAALDAWKEEVSADGP